MLCCTCVTQGNRSAEAGRKLAGNPCFSTFYHQRQSFSQRDHHRGSVRHILESAGRRLLVIVISLVVDDVEELELVHSLRGGDDAEPVTELHLLQELLGPSVRKITVLEVPAGQLVVGDDLDLAVTDLGDPDGLAQVADAALDLDLLVQELLEGGDIEDLVAGGLRSVDDEL
ncbi:hypothetical protein FJTKL_03930 [Diaporthe vaccinii]|uniref:Uncharacterized protein n=1 Tax=Diaporthe vaccinii TaxID=105482 RepID=A0ABR4F1M0_9PEZI